MLPICSSCKKIRDDKGYWNQIEEYIRDHSEAEFTHYICQECAEKLYPEFNFKKTDFTIFAPTGPIPTRAIFVRINT